MGLWKGIKEEDREIENILVREEGQKIGQEDAQGPEDAQAEEGLEMDQEEDQEKGLVGLGLG